MSTVSRTITSLGTMKAVDVEVYWDDGCTDIVTAVNWRILEPGATAEKTVYVKNTGNAPVTLSMTVSGWDPIEAEGQINISWDKEDTVVEPGAVVAAVLTLAILLAISGITDFSSNITIEGTG